MATTAPAHASIFTGLHPHAHGVGKNGDVLGDEIAAFALARRLAAAGYRCGAFVTLTPFGSEAALGGGFERFDVGAGGPLRPGGEVARAALHWLDADPQREQPSFLWMHLYDVHSPYGSAETKPRNYPPAADSHGWVAPARFAEAAERNEMARQYRIGVREADAALGVLSAGLEERGMHPLIAVTADHGEFLDERLADGFAYGHAALLGNEVLRVPLLLVGPGIEPGRVRAPVTIRDLYPTLLGAAGLEDGGAKRAGAERFDLRGALPVERVLAAARRSYAENDELGQRFGGEALRLIRAGAVATTDGARLLVMGVDGGVDGTTEPPAALVGQARRMLEAVQAAEATAGAASPEIDPETRRQLEELGYVP